VHGPMGSGKSWYAVRAMTRALLAGKVVVTNITLTPGWEEVVAGHALWRRAVPGARARKAAELRSLLHVVSDLDELQRIRVRGTKEDRWLVVIDEAHKFLNAREWESKGRIERVGWFTDSRQLGAEVLLLTQAVENVDAQVRRAVEFTTRLRNLKSFRVAGIPLVPMNRFLAITVWDDTSRSVLRREFYGLNRRLAGIYRTHGTVTGGVRLDDPDALWLPRSPRAAAPGEPQAAGAGLDASGPVVAGIAVGPPLIAVRPRVLPAPELAPDVGASVPRSRPLTSPPPPPAPPATDAPQPPLVPPPAPLAPSMQAFPSAPGNGVADVTEHNAERPPHLGRPLQANSAGQVRSGLGRAYPPR
jgi:hypothetical protein